MPRLSSSEATPSYPILSSLSIERQMSASDSILLPLAKTIPLNIFLLLIFILNGGNGAFAPKVDYSAHVYPMSVAIGDLNNDDKLDLAVANAAVYNDSTGCTLRGNGDGTFATRVKYNVGVYSQPYSVAIGNINNDGNKDLVVAKSVHNYGAGISVLMNNGSGGFPSHTNYPTGGSGYSVALGDFNGDGSLDAAMANYNYHVVSIFFNDGTGVFNPYVNHTTGTNPSSVAVGDLDGDNKPDLAVANYTSNTVSVFLNDGSGGFPTRIDYPTGRNPRGVAIGDLNGDGKPDLATANKTSNTVSIFFAD